MINKPLFTIVTASFNSALTIKRTVKSVLAQTITDFEYIIVDGNSKDSTLAIVKSFEVDFKKKGIVYKWISEKDFGIYDAFNKGIKEASGKWISFLGSDDFYLKIALASYKKKIEDLNFEPDFIHSSIKIDHKICFKKAWKWKDFKRKMTIAHAGGFHNAAYFQKYGLFDTNYKIAADYELLLRAKDKLKTSYLNNFILVMSSEGISNNRVIDVYKETTSAKIKIGLNRTLAKADFILWSFKYKVKNILHAVIR
ncbi:glycosyltransferase family 2 protein [uncultured Polaribacter sp.]|uniref:glycosyltransferase family 2 protein n=1 Tax=uncultured Polaribacter sp. TaxID=174711 RepID=UPI0026392C55|nr:glycosyltransferase family 2 protein [uncultured Polaribacter sp.]